MTSSNNLALLLSEVLDGMEKNGNSNCEKSGKGKKGKKCKNPSNSNSLSQCKHLYFTYLLRSNESSFIYVSRSISMFVILHGLADFK